MSVYLLQPLIQLCEHSVLSYIRFRAVVALCFVHLNAWLQNGASKMKVLLSIWLATSAATLANAHGYFTSPKARQPGPAMEAACGQQAFDNMASDINGNIQGLQQVTANQPDYNPNTCKNLFIMIPNDTFAKYTQQCLGHLWKCKGMKYADNKANVQQYTAGQTVPLNFDIVAPHDGYANVSIIGLNDDNVLATLKSWKQYALTSIPIKPGWEKFSVTMPTSLGSQCAQPGHCAIQMYWNAPSIDQTYESCIDITVGGSTGKRYAESVELESRAHARDFMRV